MVITNNNELMIFGGVDSDECYKLVKGSWEKQNALTRKREYAVAIVMSNGIYVFGGQNTACRSDFLPNGQDEWQEGPVVPYPGIRDGHGVAISQTELLLVGGDGSKSDMLKFNIESKKWTVVGSLLKGRYDHRCFIVNSKMIVTGGIGNDWNALKSTEVVELSIWKSKYAGDLNVARSGHGMGIVYINGKSKLVVFGGRTTGGSMLDSIEEWDEDTETWTMSSMKLSNPNCLFAYSQSSNNSQ